LSLPAWVKGDDPGADLWGGVADNLFGESLTGEKAGQFLVAMMADREADNEWPAEHVALWRLAVWCRGMVDELETGEAPTFTQFFIRGGTEADENLVGEEACSLLRDIFGNPFRPVALDPAWLTWHDGLLVSMARRMYDSRDFTDMPILADALEEAGCSDQDILAHCRQPGEHVRGCWIVDLFLENV
jgi:hypothetical protein